MSATCRFRRPESVLVLVYAVSGEVLLLQRNAPFGFWQSVTGALEAGEDHRTAARRELAEETGLCDEGELYYSGRSRVFDIDPRWRHRYGPDVDCNTEFEWHYRLAAACAVQLDSAEHSGYCWMPVKEAASAVWSWTNREALQNLQACL